VVIYIFVETVIYYHLNVWGEKNIQNEERKYVAFIQQGHTDKNHYGRLSTKSAFKIFVKNL